MQVNHRISVVAILSFALSAGLGTGSAWYGVTVQAADQRVSPLAGNTIADIAEKASPAVVNLEMRRKLSLNMQGMPQITEFFLNGQRMQLPKFFGMQQEEGDEAPSPQAKPLDPHSTQAPAKPNMHEMFSPKPDVASGFIIRSDGYILTNLHAVAGQDAIKVTLFDKRSYNATVVGSDQFSDLAVIKIDAKDLPVLPWGSSATLRPGEFAVAIGSPQGEDHTVTLGIVSAVGRTEVDVNGNINFIQTDAAINPGNSGGPLLNLNGEVVGVNTAIRVNAQNIAYSIPSDVARSVADTLIVSGKIERPWLGLKMNELDETYLKGTGLPADTKGVLIRDFVEGSPALASGLKRYDIIQKIDGKEMLVPKDVKDYVQGRKAGAVLSFIVLRDKDRVAVSVNVGNYPRKVVNPH